MAVSSAASIVFKDGKKIVQGTVFDIGRNPFQAELDKLKTEGAPGVGTSGAPVAIVEFSDFQCPHCRQLYENMKILTTHYPQVRVVFKNFPIAAVHPWALTAAIGGRCAYQQSPDGFWKVHDGLFENQDLISAADIWERLLAYAGQAGLDKDAFKACMASPEAKQAVETELAEGQVLSVNSTPTVFVNGRPVVGGDPSVLQQFIDFELGIQHGAQTGSQQPGQPAGASPKPAAKPASKP